VNSFFDEVVANYYLRKQMLLDLIALLEGNVTDLLEETINWVAILAGVLYDIEAMLEKVITLLTG
jgi:hypothetical protein